MLALAFPSHFGVAIEGLATIARVDDDGLAIALAQGLKDVLAEGAYVRNRFCVF